MNFQIFSLKLIEKTYNKNRLHELSYRDLRETYPNLQSSLIQCARDMASDMLKREKFLHKKPLKRLFYMFDFLN